MRLSATERIMREAEEKETSDASSRPVEGSDAAPSSTARDLFKLQDLQADFDVDIEEIDDGEDEEGETLVDAERAAAALRELRSYGAPASRRPSIDAATRSMTRSAHRDTTGLAPTPKAPAPVATTSAQPTPTLRWAGGVPPGPAPRVPQGRPRGIPPGRPGPRTSTQTARAATGSPGAGEGRRGSAALSNPARSLTTATSLTPAGALPIAGALADSSALAFENVRRRRTVGRRSGILIAAGTAVAVALGVGAWTGRPERPATTAARRESSAVATGTLANTAVIVPTVHEVPAAPAEDPSLYPPSAPAPRNPSSTANLDSTARPPTVPAPAVSPTGPGPRHPSATGSKSRPSRKGAASKARRSKHRVAHHAAKVAAPRAQPRPAVTSAAPPPARVVNVTRAISDPDATLPIGD